MTKIIVRLISAGITVGMGVLLNYLALPAWTLQSGGMWAYIIVMLCVAFVCFGIGESFLHKKYDSIPVCSVVSVGCIVIAVVALIICSLTGAKMFNADKYQKLIEFKTGNFAEDITEVTETSKISTVDWNTAEKLGDRTIGAIKDASWYEVDSEYNLIEYNGKQYRISVLNYGGFFKYNKAKEYGIPGYVLVAVTQEAQFVKTKKPIYYSTSAYFEKDLKRHLRNQYPSYIFDTAFFEIDDEGTPFYIVSVVSPKIGVLGGKTVDKFIIVNASTGECKEYSPKELPSWVDHAYGVSYLMQLAEYNMEYVNGYFNFSKTGVLRTTYYYMSGGYNSIISKDGMVFYTGLTPANSAETNVGYITANPRTGVIKKYNYAGAEESSAQAAAEGIVQNLGYTATFPNILNVDGTPTYFMCLKDNAGLIQRYSFCNIVDYTQVVEGKTLDEALKLYREKIGTDLQQETEIKEITGKIETLYKAEIDGNTYFYYFIEDDNNLYMSSIKNGNKQVALKVGDTITLIYSETSENGVYLVSKITF